MAEISEIIQKLAGTHGNDNLQLLQGVVKSVDLNKQTCSIISINGKGTLKYNCLLNSGVSDGVIYEPKVDSNVFFLTSKSSPPFIIQYSDVVTLNFLGDEHGGLVIVGKLVDRINQLETIVKDFITQYNSHTHATDGVVTTNLQVDKPVLTKISDLENKNIKHGS
jgi:hypothetical protein